MNNFPLKRRKLQVDKYTHATNWLRLMIKTGIMQSASGIPWQWVMCALHYASVHIWYMELQGT